MVPVNFDSTLTLGVLLNAVVIIVTAFVAVTRIRAGIDQRLAVIEAKIDTMWHWFEKRLLEVNGRHHDG